MKKVSRKRWLAGQAAGLVGLGPQERRDARGRWDIAARPGRWVLWRTETWAGGGRFTFLRLDGLPPACPAPGTVTTYTYDHAPPVVGSPRPTTGVLTFVYDASSCRPGLA